MTVKERLVQFIKYLAISQKAFERKVGFSNGYINNISKSIQPDKVQMISLHFPELSLGWLLSGEGKMLKNEKIHIEATEVQANPIVVPLISVKAQSAYLAYYNDVKFIDGLPKTFVHVDRNFRGAYRCFEVNGDSMNDGSLRSICEGDIILGREVKRDLWGSKLPVSQWYFIINHTDGVLISQIVNHNVEKGVITCHSLNSQYGPDFDLALSDVRELYSIIKITERVLRF